jgi:hypothetical protein
VIELGLGGAGATLAARRLDFPDTIVTNGDPEDPNRFRQWTILGDNQPYDWVSTLKAVYAPLNFPYGLPVEPDGPV